MKSTTKDSRAAITERLQPSTPGYAIDYDFARHFAALTGRPETSILSNLRELAAHYERTENGTARRGKYERSVRLACESIWGWFIAGERQEYHTDDMISFVESHCQQCVWAVLVGDFCVRRDHPEVFDELNHAI